MTDLSRLIDKQNSPKDQTFSDDLIRKYSPRPSGSTQFFNANGRSGKAADTEWMES
jgi:hypothetical protein